MKSAGAFKGLPRELRHNMQRSFRTQPCRLCRLCRLPVLAERI